MGVTLFGRTPIGAPACTTMSKRKAAAMDETPNPAAQITHYLDPLVCPFDEALDALIDTYNGCKDVALLTLAFLVPAEKQTQTPVTFIVHGHGEHYGATLTLAPVPKCHKERCLYHFPSHIKCELNVARSGCYRFVFDQAEFDAEHRVVNTCASDSGFRVFFYMRRGRISLLRRKAPGDWDRVYEGEIVEHQFFFGWLLPMVGRLSASKLQQGAQPKPKD
jgi:hypothetical protein